MGEGGGSSARLGTARARRRLSAMLASSPGAVTVSPVPGPGHVVRIDGRES